MLPWISSSPLFEVYFPSTTKYVVRWAMIKTTELITFSGAQTKFVSSSSKGSTVITVLKSASVLKTYCSRMYRMDESIQKKMNFQNNFKTKYLLTGIGVLSLSMFPNQSPTFHFLQPIGSGVLSSTFLRMEVSPCKYQHGRNLWERKMPQHDVF